MLRTTYGYLLWEKIIRKNTTIKNTTIRFTIEKCLPFFLNKTVNGSRIEIDAALILPVGPAIEPPRVQAVPCSHRETARVFDI